MKGYFVGLDLGQSQDYTALVVLERHGRAEDAEFHARYLHRFPLGTPYPAIVDDVAMLCTKEPLSTSMCELIVDATGVGSPVVDLFRAKQMRPSMTAVCITSGTQVTALSGSLGVPKTDLVAAVQIALQTGKLKIAASLPLADTLTKELQNFQVKITNAANEVYGTWREGQHDDLVLALSLALWFARRWVAPRSPATSVSLNFRRR